MTCDRREFGAADAVDGSHCRRAPAPRPSCRRPPRRADLLLPRAAAPAGGDLVDPIIAAMKECGLTECELWAPQIEPASPVGRGRPTPEEAQQAREALRTWRLETPLDHFRGIRKKFEAAGMIDLRLQLQPERQLHRRRRSIAASRWRKRSAPRSSRHPRRSKPRSAWCRSPRSTA